MPEDSRYFCKCALSAFVSHRVDDVVGREHEVKGCIFECRHVAHVTEVSRDRGHCIVHRRDHFGRVIDSFVLPRKQSQIRRSTPGTYAHIEHVMSGKGIVIFQQHQRFNPGQRLLLISAADAWREVDLMVADIGRARHEHLPLS